MEQSMSNEVAPEVQKPASTTSVRPADPQSPQKWWQREDFPMSAPWWVRYPLSAAFFYGSYWSFFEWDRRLAGWVFGPLLLIGGMGLARELIVGILVAAAVGIGLWAIGAAFAALPVSAAIIIGAIIIAQAVKR
jgi:hypothetical protein